MSATETDWLIIIAQKVSPGKDQLCEPAVILAAVCTILCLIALQE